VLDDPRYAGGDKSGIERLSGLQRFTSTNDLIASPLYEQAKKTAIVRVRTALAAAGERDPCDDRKLQERVPA